MIFWRNKKFFIPVVLLIVFGSGLAVYMALGNDSTQNSPITKEIQSQVNFPLYYPASLPADFKFEEITYDTEAHVVIYKYSSGSKRLLFSLQEKTSAIEYNRLRDTQMTDVKEISVPAGQALMGILEKQLVSAVFSANTIIFINAAGTSTPQDLETATRSLAPVK